MRVRGDNAPSNAFSLEEQPNKPGVALVRFYENAEPFEEKRDELKTSSATMPVIWRKPSCTRRRVRRSPPCSSR